MSASMLKQLQDSPEFQAVMEDILRLRPLVPKYFPDNSEVSEQVLLNRIKYQSGRLEGFDNLWTTLTGRAIK